MFVFKPSEPRPLFSQKAVCSGRVSHAVFAPREEMLAGCEESSQWLKRSQLYFLTHNMVTVIIPTPTHHPGLWIQTQTLTLNPQ